MKKIDSSLKPSKVILSGLNKTQIESLVVNELHWPAFRAKQIQTWLYTKNSGLIEEWTNLSLRQREQLKAHCQVALLQTSSRQISTKDGTEKYLFSLPDGKFIETVLMRFLDRTSLTACLSSQVGCAIGCPFCATGKLGFKRNLTPPEIVDQVMSVQRTTGERISNLVFMGQGEPLNNLEAVLEAIQILRDSVGIGARHITLSTSGIVPQILKLAEYKIPVNLAISLHTANQELREKLVPIAKYWSLFELIESLKTYFTATGRRLTFEYALLEDINDSAIDARALADLVRDLPFPCLINLIPYNETRGEFKRPSKKRIEAFKKIAERSGQKVTVRVNLGNDIDAACGQLASKKEISTSTATSVKLS